ncbi:TIM barrel protein [Devosia sp. UYZn731]|uniref:TIM barrel protein n=1 Tax=Devosia sp. UYZn731 TaxID=3156345 RepID=UPI003394AA50
MVAPQLGLADFFALTRSLGLSGVEIRNDVAGNAILDGTPASTVKSLAAQNDVSIISINALQKFNHWSAERADEAQILADYAAACGSKALVLVAANDGTGLEPDVRVSNATEALTLLAPILRQRGLVGLVECLGFEVCSLRSKREAVAAINAADAGDVFKLIHDTFHHHLAGEEDIFPDLTGLIHISGVDDPTISVRDMRDSHRVLVGPKDRLGNLEQITALYAGGYSGLLSFEPFAEELRTLSDPAAAIRKSMDFVTNGLAARAA